MSVIGSNILAGTAAQAGDFELEQSLRFEDGDSPYLSRTPSSIGNRKTWTWSGWVKRSAPEQRGFLFWSGTDISNNNDGIEFDGTQLRAFSYLSGSAVFNINSNAARYRDPSAWYHIVVCFNSTESTAADRAKLYVNGERLTGVSETQASQNANSAFINTTTEHRIGNANGSHKWDGYIAEVHFVDGQALTPASFGETDSSTNQWKPKEVTGMTYGTNGFYLPFSGTDSPTAITDSSGSSHTVTVAGDAKKVRGDNLMGSGKSVVAYTSGSGNWTCPPGVTSVEVLVVAAGGGGGGLGGGGGGGGVVHHTSKSVTAGTNYAYSIGTGGSGNSYNGGVAGSGGNTTFDTITAVGGGGGSGQSAAGANGGSGGGGNGGYASAGGSGTQADSGGGTGYGNNGGAGYGGDYFGGGGGGAGAAGGAGNSPTGKTGAGGDGKYFATFAGYGEGGYFGGGGAGGGGTSTATGVAGLGGGGTGSCGGSGAGRGESGTANTGGGGGGGANETAPGEAGGDGGSGVVLIAWSYDKGDDASIKFDGTGDFLSVPDSADWEVGTNSATWEFWVRPEQVNTVLWERGDNAERAWQIFLRSDTKIEIYLSNTNGSWDFDVTSAATLSGAGTTSKAWYHIALVKNGSDIRLYINGVLDSNFSSTTQASVNTGSTYTNYIGAFNGSSNLYVGYMSDIRFSNSARYTSNFTPPAAAFSNDSNTKLLISANGFTSIGSDSSGNFNYFDPTNIGPTDIVKDTPTNNFATLNPLIPPAASGSVFSEGNLKYRTYKTGGDNVQGEGTIGFTSGKWYWEIYLVGFEGSTAKRGGIGVGDANKTGNETWTTACTEAAILAVGNLNPQAHNVVNASTGSSWSAGAAGDIWCCAFDADAGTFIITKNTAVTGSESDGKWTGFATSTIGYRPITVEQSASDYTEFVYNFGQDSSFAGAKTAQGNQDGNKKGDFYYAPPSGYLALCTDNLDDPSIADPGKHFNTVLYTGTGSELSVTGVGFQPDFSWLKTRATQTYNHRVFDVVRGVTKEHYTNVTNAEVTDAQSLKSFDSDGFTLGTSSGVNQSGVTFASWHWKAGGTASSNTDGSLTSSVSANTTAGFSVLTYTGNATAGATVGHGLSQAPELVINKTLGAATQWYVNATAVSDTSNKVLMLNDTGALDAGTIYFNDTNPTATLITLGSYGNLNSSGSNVIYCWHSVEGYSRVGKYTGNGATDGPFVYTGFRPAFLMVKLTSASNGYWVMFDNKRDPDNPTDRVFYANETSISTDVSSYSPYDLLSNGFKSRIPAGNGNEASYNSDGATYIYLAFAESPFKTANAR